MENATGPDTRQERPEGRDDRFDELYAEAKATLGYAANQLRTVTERYREAHREMLARWHQERDNLERIERRAVEGGRARAATAAARASAAGTSAEHPGPPAAEAGQAAQPGPPAAGAAAHREAVEAGEAGPAPTSAPAATLAQGPASPAEVAIAKAGDGAASAAEHAAQDEVRRDVRRSVDLLGAQLGEHQRELSRLEIATRNLENAWLFVERGDASLVTDENTPLTRSDLRMRIVEAQEAERTRLAQEVHDGPAQSITNAFFQVDYVERLMDRDPRLARTELRYLRETMRRELADIRSFISQLRPPQLEDLGLDGAVLDTVQTFATLIGIHIEADLKAPADRLGEMEQTVVLRVLQEALQNIRKHAGAQAVTVSTEERMDGWVLEVRDDGRGFDIDAVAVRGRRNFGLQFMRERAELIGGRLEVRSRPGAGTVVRLTIGGEGEAR